MITLLQCSLGIGVFAAALVLVSLRSAANARSLPAYAAKFGLLVLGQPRQHFTAAGSPFILQDNRQEIWSLPVEANGAPAVLWMRTSVFDNVILVDAQNRHTELK